MASHKTEEPRGRDRMVVEFTTTCAIREFEPCSWRGVLDKTFYPAMTAFTDQYSLSNIFFDIGQL